MEKFYPITAPLPRVSLSGRVTDEPYVELKDSEGRPDMVVVVVAWENHSLRNKAIIVDLFHGQLTCKVCGHESVRCDPFFSLNSIMLFISYSQSIQ